MSFLNWPVLLAVIAAFAVLRLRGVGSFAWTLAIWAGIWAFVRFGLKDLNDLPKIEDMVQALGFDPPALLMEKPITDEMLPLDAGDDVPVDEAPVDGAADEPADR